MSNPTLATSSTVTVGAAHILSTARLGVAMSGLLAQWLRGLTINAHERLALAHLWEHGSMTMSELGSRIPLSRAAVTALTDRLEALGYVERSPDAQDRRRTVLSLTERPAGLIAEMVQTWEREASELSNSFDADELQAIARWNDGLREISHRHAGELRSRSDGALPSGAITA